MSQALNTNRYDETMRRVGDLKGPGSKVSEVLPEVFPVVSLEDLPHEMLALQGWRTCWHFRQINPGGSLAVARFNNPPGSGHIIAVTRIDWEAGVAPSTVLIGPEVGEAAGTQGFFRDTRFGLATNTVGRIDQDVFSVPAAALRFVTGNGEVIQLEDQNGIMVLTPGTALTFADSSTTNQSVLNIWWRERTALASELNF